MIEERTLNCHLHNHPEFVLFYDEDQLLEEDVNWLIASIEAEVANGHQFEDGDIFQIGWMMAKVLSHPDNLLTLIEPDLKEIPIKYIHSITNCLIHLRWQKEILTSYGITTPSAHPNISQNVLICNHLYSASEFAMQRLQAEESDSGWQIVCVDPEHDHQDHTQLERISLYELATNIQAKTIPFLALPEGSQIILSGHQICFLLNNEELHIVKGSFLDTTGYTELE